MKGRMQSLGRQAATALALLAVGGTLAWAGPPLSARPGSADWAAQTPDAQFAALAATLGWLVLAWLLLAALLSAAAGLPGVAGRIADVFAARIAPAAVRRGVEAALGIVVTASLATPSAALAAAAPPRPAAARASVATSSGWQLGDRVYEGAAPELPEPDVGFDRPAQGPSPAPATKPAVPKPVVPLRVVQGTLHEDGGADHALVVRAGDSLWLIAARELGPGASDADVDARWRQWYAANRADIGADPDLISPGTRLVSPAADADR